MCRAGGWNLVTDHAPVADSLRVADGLAAGAGHVIPAEFDDERGHVARLGQDRAGGAPRRRRRAIVQGSLPIGRLLDLTGATVHVEVKPQRPARGLEAGEIHVALPHSSNDAFASHTARGAVPGQPTEKVTVSPSIAPSPSAAARTVRCRLVTVDPSAGASQRTATAAGVEADGEADEAGWRKQGTWGRGRGDGCRLAASDDEECANCQRGGKAASHRAPCEERSDPCVTGSGLRDTVLRSPRTDPTRWVTPTQAPPVGLGPYSGPWECWSQPATRNGRRSRHAAPAAEAARIAPSRIPSSDTWRRSTP